MGIKIIKKEDKNNSSELADEKNFTVGDGLRYYFSFGFGILFWGSILIVLSLLAYKFFTGSMYFFYPEPNME